MVIGPLLHPSSRRSCHLLAFFLCFVLTHLKILGVELKGCVLVRGRLEADEYHVAVAVEFSIAEYVVEVEGWVGGSVCIYLDLEKKAIVRRQPRVGRGWQKREVVLGQIS